MQFTKTTGIHIPYRGSLPAVSDLIGGHVQLAFQNLPGVISQVKGGQIKAIAIASEERDPQLPNTPTLKEAGYPEVVVYSWQAMAAPKGLPPEIREKVTRAAIGALNEPSVKERFGELGFSIVGNSNAEFEILLKAEQTRWRKLIREVSITVH